MAGNDSSSDIKAVDSSLWWDSFSSLLSELENVYQSPELPSHLEEKLKENHGWFLDTVKLFKPPSQKSRDALEAKQVKIGSHILTIQPQFKSAALKFSSLMLLDEVQSYILVERSSKRNTSEHLFDELQQLVLVQFYVERQCLLKCTRQILMHAFVESGLKENHVTRGAAQKLISEGLERNLLSVLEELLSCAFPDQLDVDLYTLWAEETLVEDNLVLDILFLVYYESVCACNSAHWKKMLRLFEGSVSGSLNLKKLAISTDAICLVNYTKVQLLLTLIETLQLETLLHMVHDQTPFSQGSIAFSLADIQEMDAMISGLDALQTKESGPLILGWAVFLCLISSLPGKDDNSELMEFNHVSYARQAIEAESLSYFFDILESNILMESDGPIAGFRSVLRTFVSAFVASYEISLEQSEDPNLKLILKVLCKIYQGEESLCIQFWDRDSFVDGPIRCLVCSLESEFPVRAAELVQMLSALAEGAWPAQCVYDFLDKSVGISSLFEMSRDSGVDDSLKIVKTDIPLHVPGVEGLMIPSNTRGQFVKMLDGCTALVRWEYRRSGLVVLLLRLAQELYFERTEEVLLVLDLLNRLVSFNMAVCYALMFTGKSHDGIISVEKQQENYLCFDVVEMICSLVKNQPPTHHGAAVMSMGVSILARMLKCTLVMAWRNFVGLCQLRCQLGHPVPPNLKILSLSLNSPCHVGTMILRINIFEVVLQNNKFDSSGLYSEWLLSGKLAKMLRIDCEENESLLTLAVLDLTIQLVEAAFGDSIVLALVTFSLQYVLVTHDVWTYKSKHARWKVTLKVLEVVRTCISSAAHSEKFGNFIKDILLSDSSVHHVLFHIVCTAAAGLEKLWSSRLYDTVDIEGLQQAACSVLDILFSILLTFSKDLVSSSTFHQAILSPVLKPVPVVTAVISLISYHQDCKMQISAARLMSMMLVLGDSFHSFASTNACLGLDPEQIYGFQSSLCCILAEQSQRNEELTVAAFDLLTSAALYQDGDGHSMWYRVLRNLFSCLKRILLSYGYILIQPAFLNALISSKDNSDALSCNTSTQKHPNKSVGTMGPEKTNIADIVMTFVRKSDDLLQRKPNILLKVLNFLKALWQGAPQFTDILDQLKNNRNFWGHLIDCLTLFSNMPVPENPLDELSESEIKNLAYRYYCQSDVLEVIAFEMFLQKKIFHDELLTKEKSEQSTERTDKVNGTRYANNLPKEGLSNVLSSSFKSSLGNLIKLYASCMCTSRLRLHAKVAASLFCVHMMERLKSSNMGHTSISLAEKILSLWGKMKTLPAFSDLLARYAQRGYSQGNDLQYLILNDLYYHLEGELEGRQIDDRSFKELMLFLSESNFLSTYLSESVEGLQAFANGAEFYNLSLLQSDLALDLWDFSEWKESKAVAEKMLLLLKDMNGMVFLSSSKLSALKALVTMLSLYCDHSTVNGVIIGGGGEMPNQLISSCIDHACQCLQATTEALGLGSNCNEDFIDVLAAQAELLFHLIKSRLENLSPNTCLVILKNSGQCLRVLSGFRAGVGGVTKHLLMLILLVVKPNLKEAHLDVRFTKDSVEDSADLSSMTLTLLPILCRYIQLADHLVLSLSAVDLILRRFLTPGSWFPVIQKHLQLHFVVQKLLDKNPETLAAVLKFLLTISCVREGAKMLLDAGFFASIRGVLAALSDYVPGLVVQSECTPPDALNKNERPEHLWGLCVAVVTSVIQALGDISSVGVVDYVIAHVLLEKADVVSYFLSAPESPGNVHEKKRARSLKRPASLSTLKETEHTLLLICVVARHWNSWNKAMKEVDSQFRERIIHLLAFISRGIHLNREQPGSIIPLLCHPALKEEFDWYKKPSFINSRHGWFAISPLGCGLDPKFSSLFSRTSPLNTKDQASDTVGLSHQTQFSDMTAIQIYRITFLLLKFLCIQAEGAIQRAEEVGYVDLAEFPELPMPDILHNLQDQGIVIVSELCEANKSKRATPEIEGVCLLLLKITIMALYLEFCVIQICGIRPVLGHAEDFLKQLRLLLQATEGHAFVKEPMTQLKQLVSFVYPEQLQANALF